MLVDQPAMFLILSPSVLNNCDLNNPKMYKYTDKRDELNTSKLPSKI